MVWNNTDKCVKQISASDLGGGVEFQDDGNIKIGETALKIGDGLLIIQVIQRNKVKSKDLLFNNKFICRKCDHYSRN